MRGNAVIFLPELIEAAKGRDITVCNSAVKAMGEIGGEASPAVPVILRRLENDNVSEHIFIEALGKIGPGASDALPVLRRYASRELSDDYVQDLLKRQATKAIKQIAGPEIK